MNEHKPNLPTLTQLTQRLRSANISLKWDVSLSGLVLISNKAIPAQLRHAMWRYSRELFIMAVLGDIRLCHDPERHRQYWYRLSKQFYCCERCYEVGLDNRKPLHRVADVLQVMRKEEDEVAV